MKEGLMNRILEGAYDMHVHTAPDVIDRRMDDLDLAAAYKAAGMKGFVIKSHYFETAGRAYLIRRLFPGLHAVGAIVLNRSVGGLNPEAVRMAANYGAQVVYMPTVDAFNMSGNGSAIRVYAGGSLDPAIDEILDIVRDHDMVLCSGHIAPQETLALFERAGERGVRKMLATHVEWKPTRADVPMQRRFTECGAFLEHCVINLIGGDLTISDLVEQIHEIGAEHMVLSTDLGQAHNPAPYEALEEYADKLLRAGVTEEELRMMLVTNPARLLSAEGTDRL